MLRFIVTDGEGVRQFEHAEGPIEFGRSPGRGQAARHVLNSPHVSRDHLRIQEIPGGRIAVENLSLVQTVSMTYGDIPPGQGRILDLPVRFAIGPFRIDVSSVGSADLSMPSMSASVGVDERPEYEPPRPERVLVVRGGQGTSPGGAPPATDPVDCTVFAPPVVARGRSILVQVFAHRPEQAEAADALAREFDEEAARRACKALGVEVARGSKLLFHLAMPGLAVDDPLQEITWTGRPESAQFGVDVPAGRPAGAAIGTVVVSLDRVPVGHVKFKLTVSDEARAEPPSSQQPAGESARRYATAFISYASPDRAEVLKRVQMLAQMGIKFFQDVLNLEPGDRWERELYRHIDESDLFLLFWSAAAQKSTWVRKEVEYALGRKRGDDSSPPEIRPVILEGPPIPLPPEELAHLHFNDHLIYFMRS